MHRRGVYFLLLILSAPAFAQDPAHGKTKSTKPADAPPVEPLSLVATLPALPHWNTTVERCEEDGSMIVYRAPQLKDSAPSYRVRIRPSGATEPFPEKVQPYTNIPAEGVIASGISPALGGRFYYHWNTDESGKTYFISDEAGKPLMAARGPKLNTAELQADGHSIVEMQRVGKEEKYRLFDLKTKKEIPIAPPFAIDGVPWVKFGRYALVEKNVGGARALVDISTNPAKILWDGEKHPNSARFPLLNEDGSGYVAQEAVKGGTFDWVFRKTSDNSEVWRRNAFPEDGIPSYRSAFAGGRFAWLSSPRGGGPLKVMELATGQIFPTPIQEAGEGVTACEGGQYLLIPAANGDFRLYSRQIPPAATSVKLADAWIDLGSADYGKSQRAYDQLRDAREKNTADYRAWFKTMSEDTAATVPEATKKQVAAWMQDLGSKEYSERLAAQKGLANIFSLESSASATGRATMDAVRTVLENELATRWRPGSGKQCVRPA